jgi:hypothetical protein
VWATSANGFAAAILGEYEDSHTDRRRLAPYGGRPATLVNEAIVPKILLITTRHDLSADLLIREFERRSLPWLRWNLEDFPVRDQLRWHPGVGAFLRIRGGDYTLNNFRSAWYRRTAPPDLPGELAPGGTTEFVRKELRAFLDGLWKTSACSWVNRPTSVEDAENKLVQLDVAQQIGFLIPQTLVTNDAAAAAEFISSKPSAIAKSIASGGLEMDGSRWSLFTHAVTEGDLNPNTALEIAPCIFQERVPRKSDIRTTAVGDRLFSAEITIRGERDTREVDWRAVDSKSLHYEAHTLPPRVEELCRSMLRHFGLCYGCFDFIKTDDDRYVFLEINPSGQWGWIEHELGFPITRTLTQLLATGT